MRVTPANWKFILLGGAGPWGLQTPGALFSTTLLWLCWLHLQTTNQATFICKKRSIPTQGASKRFAESEETGWAEQEVRGRAKNWCCVLSFRLQFSQQPLSLRSGLQHEEWSSGGPFASRRTHAHLRHSGRHRPLNLSSTVCCRTAARVHSGHGGFPSTSHLWLHSKPKLPHVWWTIVF